MRIFGCLLVILMIIGGVLFVRRWHSTTPWAVGTGEIAGKSEDLPGRDKRTVVQKARSPLAQIAQNPARFANKRMTVTGRVREATKYASNRNMYMLTDGAYRLMVIDDKQPPKDLWPRTVTGVVKVVGPTFGHTQYAYLVDVKKGIHYDAPKWTDIAHFFTQKYADVKGGVEEKMHQH